MSAEDIEYMDNYKEFPTKESALDWLDNYLSLDERNNLIKALQQEPFSELCVSEKACEGNENAILAEDTEKVGRLVDADKYMKRLQLAINADADTIAEYIKRDTPIGTVKDGGRIGKLQGLQWCKNVLELDYYTVEAIPKNKIYKALSEIMKYEHEGFINISLARLDEILKKYGVSSNEMEQT